METDLLDTGLVDSLSFVEFLAQLEQNFGVQVSLDDLEIDRFRTISRIADFVTTKMSQANADTGVAAPTPAA
ncbi:MAG: acyl carrier protein [Gemmatimonadales bacterium]